MAKHVGRPVYYAVKTPATMPLGTPQMAPLRREREAPPTLDTNRARAPRKTPTGVGLHGSLRGNWSQAITRVDAHYATGCKNCRSRRARGDSACARLRRLERTEDRARAAYRAAGGRLPAPY